MLTWDSKANMKTQFKLLLAVGAMASLSACDTQQAVKHTVDLAQVRGLEDCTYYVVDPGGTSPVMRVIRCPNSTTSTRYNQGKTAVNTVVIDGVEYQRKD